MNICHLSTVHGRYDTRILLKECTSLAHSGFNVTFVVADGKGDEIKNGVHILDAGAKPKSRLKRMTSTVKLVYNKAIATKADIYHLHDPELLPLVPRLMERGKVIYDAHEDLPRQLLSKHWIPRFFRPLMASLFERVEDYYAKRVSGIIAATPFIAKRFERIHPHVCNVNNYPLLEEFEKIEDAPLKENIACYVGGIAAIRGLSEMVQAMENLDGKLILAGTFGNTKDREIAKSLPGWEKVVELGFCDRDQVKDIFRRAKVGLVLFHPCPNHINAQPNKLFEYMAAGLPVIASDFPIWRGILEASKCGVCVDPLNVQVITKEIKWFFENPEEAAAMGKSGRRAVEDWYNWEREEKKIVEFFYD